MFTLLALSSCSSSESEGFYRKGAVRFTLQTVNTRTHYGTGADNDQWKIYWDNEDQIIIHSEDCPDNHEAKYIVTPTAQQQGLIKPLDNDDQLYWKAEENAMHTFAAAFPSTATWQSGNLFRFDIPQAQPNAEGYMKDAYMVAYKAGVTNKLEQDAVLLSFKPIMTTFEITLQGAIKNAGASRTVEWVKFTTKLPNDGADHFTYNATTNTAVEEASDYTITWTPSSSMVITGAAGDTPNSATPFTVFLPHVKIYEDNPLVISVKCQEYTEPFVATLRPEEGREIEAGDKKRILLPSLMEEIYPADISAGHEAFSNEIDLAY